METYNDQAIRLREAALRNCILKIFEENPIPKSKEGGVEQVHLIGSNRKPWFRDEHYFSVEGYSVWGGDGGIGRPRKRLYRVDYKVLITREHLGLALIDDIGGYLGRAGEMDIRIYPETLTGHPSFTEIRSAFIAGSYLFSSLTNVSAIKISSLRNYSAEAGRLSLAEDEGRISIADTDGLISKVEEDE
ncbi:MAG: hypothetical protein WC595_05175 [Candidatus Nanoarchaeia archaeon]